MRPTHIHTSPASELCISQLEIDIPPAYNDVVSILSLNSEISDDKVPEYYEPYHDFSDKKDTLPDYQEIGNNEKDLMQSKNRKSSFFWANLLAVAYGAVFLIVYIILSMRQGHC